MISDPTSGTYTVDPLKARFLKLYTDLQEPVVYMNGQSFTPRLADKMNENMEFPGATGEDIEWMQNSFVATIFERLEQQKEDRFVAKEDKDKVKLAWHIKTK